MGPPSLDLEILGHHPNPLRYKKSIMLKCLTEVAHMGTNMQVKGQKAVCVNKNMNKKWIKDWRNQSGLFKLGLEEPFYLYGELARKPALKISADPK